MGTPDAPAAGWLFSPDEEKLKQHIAECPSDVLFERNGSGQHAWYKCARCGVLIRNMRPSEMAS